MAAPVWNLIYSPGLLTGIGGSVLFSAARGRGDKKKGNDYFTLALILTAFLAAVSWFVIVFWDTQLLGFFGAEETLMVLAKRYLFPVKFAVPLFLFNQMLSAFLRNDNHPGLATAAVLSGGIFNIFGDYFFVFKMDMGIEGAGLATAIGALITLLVMTAHFFSRKNSLRLVRPGRMAEKSRRVLVTGFSTFFIDVAMGILTVLFNRQIMKYLGTDALSVYGVIVNISTLVQCCAYSVGQAAQPVISMNFGAGQWARIRKVLSYAVGTAFFFGLLWTALIFLFPNGFIRIFMAPTDEIYRITPFIMRSYGISFLLLPFNVFSTYYFQSVMKPAASLGISILRGLVVSGILIWLLPVIAGADSLWFAMPVTELAVAIAVTALMHKYGRERRVRGEVRH